MKKPHPPKRPQKTKPVRAKKSATRKVKAELRSQPPAPAGVRPPKLIVDGDRRRDGGGQLPPFMIVGIGASAGGLEALGQLLARLPRDAGLVYVIVQHLAAQQESLLPELLAGSTALPVHQVTDGVSVQPNKVYVIPPNAHMGILNGVLHLVPRPTDKSQHRPIDFFLRSLAEYAGTRSIGVILSGTASDGAEGLREIKGVGGIALVQDPATAKYDGMPRAAIATGLADLVLSPGDLARELARIARHPFVRHAKARHPGDDIPMVEEDLQRIFFMLRNASGVDFTHYKQPTIKRRLQRRMVLHKLSSVEHYARFLQQNPAEVNALYQDLLIHVTRFFREPDTFTTLTDKVFPHMMQNRSANEPIRIWVPGCSTGEEPYSIGIALVEFLGDAAGSTPVQIFATDISENAIEHARTGVYPESIAADASAERLRRFFTKIDSGYRVTKTVRDVCIFARQDLTRDPPFSRLDLIVCRNVLIYLGPVLQKKLMTVFHYALRPTGYLLLGGSETIGPHSDLFSLADKRHKLYGKKMTAGRVAMDFPGLDYTSGRVEGGRKSVAEPRPGALVIGEANRIILSKYSPAGVVIDGASQIIQFRGQTGLFLEPAPGEASLNLLKMAREGLLYDLRKTLHEAKSTEHSVRRDGLRIKQNGHLVDVSVEVIPIIVPGEERHFLVLFEHAAPGAGAGAGAGQAVKPGPAGRGGAAARNRSRGEEEEKRVLRLQQELAASREYLQSIIQDLEAANEELQSANEEILSSNEELQSTNEELDTAKEELQSTNEELNTVNEELQGRNEELSHVNSDLVNLLASVQIAIVMVASDLRIRRFTPMAEKVLNLIASDLGRPISDIKPNIDCPDLETLIAESVDTVSVREREVQDRGGNWYSMRIRPYKNIDNKIDGAVLALFNIEAPNRRRSGDAKSAQQQQQKEPDGGGGGGGNARGGGN